MNKELAHMLRTAPLSTPTALSADAVRDISAALTALLADVFALYMKTKNFHWHMSGPHFRDYHLLLDDQGDQLRDDNAQLSRSMRQAHLLCDEAGDIATASLLENWIDETERRTWFLFECTRQG